MKKTIALLILLAMIATQIVGCNFFGGGAASLDPESAVKLLLAEERLNTALLKNKGNIFEAGVSVMNNLATQALASLGDADAYKMQTATVKKLGASNEQVIFDNTGGGGKITFDGEAYLFSDFIETSNSYSSFSQTANNIATMAENAALLIDDIKKNVRIVDKWVMMEEDAGYYLHVGENEEILYEKSSYGYKICKRYINEDGNNVYEFLQYDFGSTFSERLLYIPGLYFEMTLGMFSNGEYSNSDHLVCSNAKGYWESYWASPFPTHVNVSYMVMKDDICYDSFYNPATGKTVFLKIISADKTSDIFWYQGSETDELVDFDVHFSGFNNIKGVLISEIEMFEMGGEIGTVPMPAGNAEYTLLLKNGKEIKNGDTFVDGKVEVTAIRVSMTYPDYIGSLAVRITAPTVAEKLALFKEFLKEAGLTSRHNLDRVIPGVERAFDELREITKYHVWNGLNQATEENIRLAIEVENEKTEEFMKLYDAVKDAESIDFNKKSAVKLNAHFATVSTDAYRNTVQTGLSISVGSLTLSVSDTLLFIKDRAYTVNFALLSDAGLVHLEKKTGSGEASFADGESFSVTVENVTMEIPALVDGEYKLVAYISTDDGVRSSAYTALKFDTVDETEEHMLEKTKLTAKKASDGALLLTYRTALDVHTALSKDSVPNYEALYEIVAGIACEYGIPSGENLEILTDTENGVYTEMIGNETEISSGVYRLAYNVQNGEKTANGYIYVTLTIASS